jgi:hypothetical protein
MMGLFIPDPGFFYRLLLSSWALNQKNRTLALASTKITVQNLFLSSTLKPHGLGRQKGEGRLGNRGQPGVAHSDLIW